MRIGIYNEPSGGLGGSEYLSAVLSQALTHLGEVELLHHHRDLTHDVLESFVGFDVTGLSLRELDHRAGTEPDLSPWARLRPAPGWDDDLSRPYDVFISVTHSIPPYCHAKTGALVVLFPLYDRNAHWPANDPPKNWLDVRRIARNGAYRWAWRKRLESYRNVIAISEFTRFWTRQYWGIDSEVVNPPVRLIRSAASKTRTILSVGRFAIAGHRKRHPELIRCFAELPELKAQGWSLDCAGAIGRSSADADYFRAVNALASSCGVRVSPNLTRGELIRKYETASIYVHAAGLDEPDDRPDRAEHFGISTVEAMSAGCLPLAIRAGGQREIVEHGVSGFLWSNITELKEYLSIATRDTELRERMAAAARRRAEVFSHCRFVDRMAAVLGVRTAISSRVA